jgi:hypothetical protein
MYAAKRRRDIIVDSSFFFLLSLFLHSTTAKRIEATAEERKKYKFSKKGKAYFIKLIFTIPGKPVAKKKTAADTSKTKAVAKTKPVAKKTDVNPILAEAAALAARQMDARKAREAQEPAKKKAKTS